MIYIDSFNDLKDYNMEYIDEIWCIVRSLKNGLPVIKRDDGSFVDVYHIPQLSPSPELFHAYLNWKQNGQWNEDTFQEKYVPQFIAEMHGEEQRNYLNILFQRAQEKCILLLCFCTEEDMCHRSIILGIMQGIYAEKGLNVRCEGEDFTMDDYSDYYAMYKKMDSRFLRGMQNNHFTRENTFFLLVAGSRTFNDYDVLARECDKVLSNQVAKGLNIVVIEGGARGTDDLAGRYANERGYGLKVILADWDRYGKSAGFRRNEKMHLQCASPSGLNQRGCICFWDGQSKGTKHNFMLAEDYRTPIRVYNYEVGNYYTQEKIAEFAKEVRAEQKRYNRY